MLGEDGGYGRYEKVERSGSVGEHRTRNLENSSSNLGQYR